MPTNLYTIGHSTHTVEHFIGLLKQHNINALCDVRSQPYSHYNPQYNREAIARELKRNHIAYIFLGRELGARSDNVACYVRDKVQFSKLVAEPLFQKGLARLRRGMQTHTIALMCAEKDPLTCHRTILVARQLRHECTIQHIREDGHLESGVEADARLMRLLKIQPANQSDLWPSDLWRDESQCLEAAYTVQERKIAYTRASGA